MSTFYARICWLQEYESFESEKQKKENAGGTCASAVGFLAHAGGEFATAPLHPLSKPYSEQTVVGIL